MNDHSIEGTQAEYRERLDGLEQRIEGLRARIKGGSTGSMPAHHQEHLEKVDAQRQKVRRLLGETHHGGWDAARAELDREWNSLVHAFEHWSQRVDEEFAEQR